MTENSAETIDYTKAYKNTSNVMLFLTFMSIGASNLISAVTSGNLEYIDWIATLSILVYGMSAYQTRKGSKLAFMRGSVVFAMSMLYSIMTSIGNARLMETRLGEGSFVIIMGGNLLYLAIVTFFLVRSYKALPPT